MILTTGNTNSCTVCGAVFSNDVVHMLHRKKKGDNCPICNENRRTLNDISLEDLFNDVSNMRGNKIDISAVFIDYNDISTPRLVISLGDDYFHDWNSLKLPDGLTIIRTSDGSKAGRKHPIDLVYYFDRLSLDIKGDVMKAVKIISEWVNKLL